MLNIRDRSLITGKVGGQVNSRLKSRGPTIKLINDVMPGGGGGGSGPHDQQC